MRRGERKIQERPEMLGVYVKKLTETVTCMCQVQRSFSLSEIFECEKYAKN